MIIKAFNQEFNINIQFQSSEFNVKVIRLIEAKRPDLLKELNSFIKTARAEYGKVDSAAWAEYGKVDSAARAEYDKVRSAAWAEYEKKILNKLNELLEQL